VPGRGNAPTRVSFAFGLIVAASVVLSLASGPACSAIQPEVGERLAACVDADSDPATPVDFKTQIRPIIDGRVAGPRPCAECHYASRRPEGVSSQLNLETLVSLRKGGARSPDSTVVRGQPCRSVIVQKLRGTFDGGRMPLGGPYWSPEQIQLMIDWIAEGAAGGDND